MRLLTGIVILSVMGLFACSTTKGTHGAKAYSSHDHIDFEEIQTSTSNNAYDLISYLRPHWLRERGPKSIRFEEASSPEVYVNDLRHGDISSLATISTEQIAEIRFFNTGDATIRFGLNHPSGVIAVTTF
ncbi:hypothetical protein L0337_13625 [candidate division KSB1 bacterium]|nr:hypothetical protein [candidate division KSB1 bacterium]